MGDAGIEIHTARLMELEESGILGLGAAESHNFSAAPRDELLLALAHASGLAQAPSLRLAI